MIDDTRATPAGHDPRQEIGTSSSRELPDLHDIDLATWKRTQRAGIATALIGQIVLFVLFAIFASIAKRHFGTQAVIMALAGTILGLPFSVHIGRVSAMCAYYLFRRSTISVSMMAVAITFLFITAAAGWLIALVSLAN